MKIPVILLSLTLILSSSALAQEKCIQGSDQETGLDDLLTRLKNRKLVDLAGQYGLQTKAAEAISDLYAKTEANGKDGMEKIRPLVRKLDAEKEVEACIDNSRNLKELKQVISLSEIPVVKKSCIRAAMLRQHGNTEFLCASTDSKPDTLGTPGKKSGSCLTEEIVDYTWWAFHKAVYCLSDPANPVDPMILFQKINNESAFHLQAASRYGVGIGQLTTSAIGGVNERPYVKKILESNNPHCLPFKKALREVKPKTARNYCELIEPNNGLAVNLMYSISYFLDRRNALKGFNKALNAAGIEDARFSSLGGLAAYGPQGMNTQSALIAALKKSGNNYDRFEQEVIRTIPYIGNTFKMAKDVVHNPSAGINDIKDCYDPLKMQ